MRPKFGKQLMAFKSGKDILSKFNLYKNFYMKKLTFYQIFHRIVQRNFQNINYFFRD